MPRLLIDEQGQRRVIELSEEAVVVGRARDATVMITDAKSSRHHLRVDGDRAGYFVEDLGSSNGTLLNGKETRRAPLAHGDVIHIGSVSITFIEERGAPAVAAPPAPRKPAIAGDGSLLEEAATEVAAAAAPPALVFLNGDRAGERIAVEHAPFQIGRKAECHLALIDNRVSGLHCRLVREGNRWFIEDLDSGNGVVVAGRRVKRHPLYNGDVIQIGTTELRFDGVPGPQAATAGASPSVILRGVDSSEISEEELSRLAIRHREERASPLQAVWTALFLVLFLTILYLTFDLVSTQIRGQEARIDPGNLLAMNPSFEEWTEGGSAPGWSVDARGDPARSLRLEEAGLPDGRRALRLSCTEKDALGFARVISEQTILPPAAGSLRFSGMIRNIDFDMAGLEILWMAGSGDAERVAAESVSSLIEPRGSFTPLSVVAERPPIAEVTGCRVAVIGIGRGAVDVDGLTLKPDGESSPDAGFLATTGEVSGSRKIRVDFQPSGAFSVTQGGQGAISSLRIAAREARKFPFGQLLAFNADPARLRENSIVRGSFAFQDGVFFEGRRRPVSFEESAQLHGEKIGAIWRRIEGDELPAGVQYALIVELDSRAAQGHMSASCGGQLSGEGKGLAALDGKLTDEWILGERASQIVLTFSVPLLLEVLPPAQCRGVPTAALVLDGPLPSRTLELSISAASPQEEVRIRSLFSAVDTARKEGKAWRAIEVLESLEQEFAWRENVKERARSIRGEIEEVGKRLRNELDGLAKDFLKYPDSPVRNVVLSRAEETARSYRGTETGRDAERIVGEILASTRETSQRRARGDAAVLLARGQSYFEADQDGLARVYFEWVLGEFQGTNEARQASDKLELIKERKPRM